jgi:hypothetical protein
VVEEVEVLSRLLVDVVVGVEHMVLVCKLQSGVADDEEVEQHKVACEGSVLAVHEENMVGVG